MSPYSTFWDYDSGRDGQLLTATGTYLSPWFDATGISDIELRGAFTGGTTTVIVEMNREGPEGATTGAALVSGADVKTAVVSDSGQIVMVPYEFVRIKLTQTTANTTNAQIAAKGRAS